MNTRSRRPTKPEQANRDTKPSHKCRRQSFLWLQFAILVELGLHDAVEVVEEWGYDKYGADQDPEECKTFFA